MKKLLINSTVLASAAVLSLSVFVPIATAQDAPKEPTTQQTTETEKIPNSTNTTTTTEKRREGSVERKESVQVQKTVDPATRQARLEAKRLQACQNREKKISNIMSRLSDRGTKQLSVFNKISERTQAFYVEKGKTLPNYEALVAEVNAKKAAAEAEAAKTKATSQGFKCDSSNPKGAASSFKQSLNGQKDALKAYKTAVKNLVVGVKSVQGTTSSNQPAGQ